MKKITRIFLEIIAIVLSLTILLGITSYLGYRYMPLREDYGATWNMYLEEEKNSIDLLFVGSSMAYCDIIPAKFYEKTGHTAYVLSAPYLMPDVMYYYIKEALRTQSPKVIMVEATSFFFSLNEGDYYKVNIGYMPYSVNRLGATLNAAPDEYKLGLLFPLFNNHNDWEGYGLESVLAKRGDKRADLMAGYTLLEHPRPQMGRYERTFQYDDDELENNLNYMDKIIDLCEKEGVELEFFVVPTCEYVGDDHIKMLRDRAGDVRVTNFNDNFEDMELDLKKDFYDSRHTSLAGALKFTDFISRHIIENYSLPSNAHNKELWQERIDHINGKIG